MKIKNHYKSSTFRTNMVRTIRFDPRNWFTTEQANHLLGRELHEILASVYESRLSAREKALLVQFFLSAKENSVDDFPIRVESMFFGMDGHIQTALMKFFRTHAQGRPEQIAMFTQNELKSSWIQLYMEPNVLTDEASEIQQQLEGLLTNASTRKNQQLWISNVLYRLRQATRVVLKSDVRKRRFEIKSEFRENESWEWIFECHTKAEDTVRFIQKPYDATFKFLLWYERAVLFNKFGAPTRSLDLMSMCGELLDQEQKLEGDEIVHFAMDYPSEYLSMLTSLTKSRYGMHVNHSQVDNMVEFCKVQQHNSDNSDSGFGHFSVGVLHYFSLLTQSRSGVHMSNDFHDGPWHVFQKLHPHFFIKRVNNHLSQTKNMNTPWSDELMKGLNDLVSEHTTGEQRDSYIQKLAKAGKDLSTNNPLAAFLRMNINSKQASIWRDKSSLAAQINSWISYIDLVKINLLRVTKSDGSHHFVRFGPIDRVSNELSWVTSEIRGNMANDVETVFKFEQYLAQSFRISSDLKSTKMDRTNLLATILDETINALKEHTPSTIAVRDLVKQSRIQKSKFLRKPILHPKHLVNEVEKGDGHATVPWSKHAKKFQGIPVALHAHVALERIIKTQHLASEARAILQLSSIQATYRQAIKSVLDDIDEILALEFLHLLLIFRSYEFEGSSYDAHTIVEEILNGFDLHDKQNLSVPARNRWAQLKFDYHENPFTQVSPGEQLNSVLSDHRTAPLVSTLEGVQWWKFGFDQIDEVNLARTMVSWIQYQIESGPTKIVHSRFLEGESFFREGL